MRMSGQWSPARLTADGRSSTVVAVVLLTMYAAGTLYVGLHHEPWRDEADSWLVVRDAPVSTILSWTRNAGTPALWYFALKPLIWLGLAYSSQELLHLAFAWAAAAVLLFRSPFSWVTKILVLASYYVAYEYAVIARSYVLTVLLSFLIAAWYPDRDSRPYRYAIAIALLFNANVHGALIAAVLTLLFVLQRPVRSLAGPIAIIFGGAFAAWAQLRTAPDAPFPRVVREINPVAAKEAIASAFFPGLPLTAGAIAAAVVIALIAFALRRRSDALLFFASSMIMLNVLFVFVWFGGYRHAGLILICTLLAIWIAREVPGDVPGAIAAVMFHAALAVSVMFSVRMAYADVKMNFSGSKEMGEYIRDRHLDRLEIAAHNIHESEAVLPWLPGKALWYAAIGRYGTYMQWNREEEIGRHVPYDVAIARAVEHFGGRQRPWLMLLNAPMRDASSRRFRLVYATRGRVFRHPDERYWLYEWTGPELRIIRPGTGRSSLRSSSRSERATPRDSRRNSRPTAAGRS